MFAASSDPSADPAPTSVCSSSMKIIAFWLSINSFMMVFSRSSNCPRYFVPATIKERSSERIRLSARNGGTSPSEIRRAKTFFFAQDAQQQMLGADMLMAEPFRFFCRHIKDALALRAQRHFHRSGNPFANRDARFDLFANRFDRPLLPQKSVRQRLVLAHQAEQQMLRLDVRAAVLAGFVPRKEYDPTRFLCVPFEHVSSLLPLGPRSRRPQPREIAERHVPVPEPGRIARRASNCASRSTTSICACGAAVPAAQTRLRHFAHPNPQ